MTLLFQDIVQRPDGRFSVIEVDGELYIDEIPTVVTASSRLVVSLDAYALADNYELFKPQFRRRMRKLATRIQTLMTP